MKKGTVVSLSWFGGLVIGFALGYLLCFELNKISERQMKEGWTLVPVVVATTDIAAGTPIDYDLLAKRSCPEQFVTASTIRPSDFEKVIGRRLQVPMRRGDVFLWTLFSERAPPPRAPMPAGSPDPVAWWNFDEADGATVLDTSGHGHDGHIQGGAEYVQGGVRGRCLSLKSGYVQIGARADAGVLNFGPGQSFSWTCWFKPRPRTGNEMLMSRRRYRSDDDQVGHHLYLSVDGHLQAHTSGGRVSSGTTKCETLVSDGWHHAAFVRDTGARRFRLYLDGRLESELADQGEDLSGPCSFRLGQEGETTGGDRQYHGLLDDVRVFDRALSTSEISAEAAQQ